MYYVYVLKSENDGNLYIGQTNNLENRVYRHNAGYIISTKKRRPLVLVYYEEFANRRQSMRREKFLKSGEGHKYLRSKLANTAQAYGAKDESM